MQVPDQDIPFDPAGPPCSPSPNSVLSLGGFRWLGMDGRLLRVPESMSEWADSRVELADRFGEDHQSAVGSLYGEAVDLNSRTLAYWEEAANRGGHSLQDLLT